METVIGMLTDCRGENLTLPTLLGWEIHHGMGSPCDAFRVRFLYDRSFFSALSDAVRFRAVYAGETVFCGVVDEFRVRADTQGLVADVSGRSLAALLLDNQAEAAEYYGVSLDYILAKHVYPWGIAAVRSSTIAQQAYFSVGSGQSQWRVLEQFSWFGGGIRPRFHRDGTLLLNNERGSERILGAETAITSQQYRERRYGVISEVLVKNRVMGTSWMINNPTFQAKGGRCRRVINVVAEMGYDAMRYSGEYQIAQSEDGALCCELVVHDLFAAFAGDIVTLTDSPIGLEGTFLVSESRCWADGDGFGTVLTLTKEM